MGLQDLWQKAKNKLRQLFEEFRKKCKGREFRRNLLSLCVALLLLAGSLTIFLLLREGQQKGDDYGVPNDDGVLTLHTRVHPNSPLYPAVYAFQQGYVYRAVDAFKRALAGKLSQKERKSILNYLGYIYLSKRRFSDANDSFQNGLKIDNKNAPALHGLGRIQQLRGNRSKALKLYQKALDANEKFVKSMHRLGDIYGQFGDHKRAISFYENFLRIKKSPYIRYLLGNSLLQRGERIQAKKQYMLVLDNSPKKVLLAYASARLGDIYDDVKKYSKAVSYYRQAVKYYPAKEAFLFNLAVLILKLGKVSEAISILSKLEGQSALQSGTKIARTLGELFYDSKNYANSLHYFKKATKDGKNSDLYSVIADLYYLQKKFDMALVYYRKVVDIFPGSEVENIALINIGNIYTHWLKYDKALEFYMRALKKNKNSASLYFNIGVTLWKKNLYHKAADNFFRAYQLDPAFTKALRNADRAYQKSGALQKGLDLYLNLIEKSKRPAAFLYARAARFYHLLEKYKDAVKMYKNGLLTETRKGHRFEMLVGLAQVYIASGKINNTYQVLKKAYQIQKNSPMCHYLYGKTYLADKRPFRAEEAFRNALIYHPWPRLRAEIIYNLANLSFEKGDYNKALSQYKLVLETVPDHVQASSKAAQCVQKLTKGRQ